MTVNFAQAGGFGGAPPFTNGSPLVSGVDGSYQATARGNNLVGTFRFTYSGGRQTSSPDLSTIGVLTDPYNDYIFFVDGLAYRGLVQANINGSQLGGVLDNGNANVPNGVSASGTGVFAIQTFLAGYFNGSIDTGSAGYAFKGNGSVTMSTYTLPDTTTGTAGVVTEQFTRFFRFQGVRNSQSTSSGTSNTTGGTTGG